MGVKKRVEKRQTEKMSDSAFKMMAFTFKIVDLIFPYIKRRIRKFGIEEGMTVVDYGCGPGRYSTRFAEIVGEKGKVYALDIHELAIEAVRKKIEKHNIGNIKPILIQGYNSTLSDNAADVVCAIDMFWIIKKPTEFLEELRRIIKRDGILLVDDGHAPREETRDKILNSGIWKIVEETKDHLKCKPTYERGR